MKPVKGSLTVEAALVYPILLLLMLFTLQTGLCMYTECRDTAVSILEEQDLDIIKIFYLKQNVEGMTGDGDSVY